MLKGTQDSNLYDGDFISISENLEIENLLSIGKQIKNISKTIEHKLNLDFQNGNCLEYCFSIVELIKNTKIALISAKEDPAHPYHAVIYWKKYYIDSLGLYTQCDLTNKMKIIDKIQNPEIIFSKNNINDPIYDNLYYNPNIKKYIINMLQLEI